jgi:hypothetical protein
VISSKTGDENATEAPYRVCYRTALELEAHMFAGILITPRAVEKTTCVSGEKSKKKEKTVHLSNNTVKRPIKFYQQIQQNNWCRDLDPALLLPRHLKNETDVSGLAVLLFALYLSQNKIQEYLLSKRAVLKLFPLPTNCPKLDVQGMLKQNLNTVTDSMSRPT